MLQELLLLLQAGDVTGPWWRSAFCFFLLGKTERVTKMGFLWMNSMVYGRCNELVNGDEFMVFLNQQTLVGDWNHGIWIDFPMILGIIIIPTDFHIFQRGRLKPPTSYGCFVFSKIHPKCSNSLWTLVPIGVTTAGLASGNGCYSLLLKMAH